MATAGKDELIVALPRHAKSLADTIDEEGRLWLLLGLSEEMNHQIEELALRTGDTKANLINKALGLYKAISDASRQGKHAGIATTDDDLETEFVGF
jgi:hypothetical protein